MASWNCPTQLVESDSRDPWCDRVKPLSESVFSEIIDIILHRHSINLIRISHMIHVLKYERTCYSKRLCAVMFWHCLTIA